MKSQLANTSHISGAGEHANGEEGLHEYSVCMGIEKHLWAVIPFSKSNEAIPVEATGSTNLFFNLNDWIILSVTNVFPLPAGASKKNAF